MPSGNSVGCNIAIALFTRSAALAAQRSATLANEAVTDGHTQAQRMSEITLAHPNPCERLRSVPGRRAQMNSIFSLSETRLQGGQSKLARLLLQRFTTALGHCFILNPAEVTVPLFEHLSI